MHLGGNRRWGSTWLGFWNPAFQLVFFLNPAIPLSRPFVRPNPDPTQGFFYEFVASQVTKIYLI